MFEGRGIEGVNLQNVIDTSWARIPRVRFAQRAGGIGFRDPGDPGQGALSPQPSAGTIHNPDTLRISRSQAGTRLEKEVESREKFWIVSIGCGGHLRSAPLAADGCGLTPADCLLQLSILLATTHRCWYHRLSPSVSVRLDNVTPDEELWMN